jgi:hypothetical protein
MNFEDCLHDALDAFLAGDLPDAACSAAVVAQAAMLAGLEPEEIPALYAN